MTIFKGLAVIICGGASVMLPAAMLSGNLDVALVCAVLIAIGAVSFISMIKCNIIQDGDQQ